MEFVYQKRETGREWEKERRGEEEEEKRNTNRYKGEKETESWSKIILFSSLHLYFHPFALSLFCDMCMEF